MITTIAAPATAAIAAGRSLRAAPPTTDPPPVLDVTVTDEPGVCTNQGSLCERLYDWTGNEELSETASWALGTPFKIVVILVSAFVLNRLSRRAIRVVTDRIGSVEMPTAFVSETAAHRTEQRAHSIGTLLRSAASTVIFGTATVMVLDNLGISVVPLVASLGIAGIAIGFGAQSFVEDLIAGVMMLVEDQFGVGDRIDTGTVEGTVERLTLRSTVIIDARGLRWYLPNSEIRRVSNESQGKSQATARIGIPYQTDLSAAATILHEAATEVVEGERWQRAGVEPVKTPFVAELGSEVVVLEIRALIDSTERRALESELRARLVAAAVSAGIELPSSDLEVSLQQASSTA